MMNFGKWCPICQTKMVYGWFHFREGIDGTMKRGYYCPSCRLPVTIESASDNSCE